MITTYEINIIIVVSRPPMVASMNLNNDGFQPMPLMELSEWMWKRALMDSYCF